MELFIAIKKEITKNYDYNILYYFKFRILPFMFSIKQQAAYLLNKWNKFFFHKMIIII
jgi:hypothetical protein